MKTLAQLREEFPALRKYSDAELKRIRADLYTSSRLMITWWIETNLGPRNLPLGRLPAPDEEEYDTEVED